MSEGLPLLDAEHPWPGLFPYGEDAHAFFNGRERETIDLLRLVRRDALTLLYGQSGLGKSSLLRAGLFPQLREEALLPIYLRLDFRNRELGLREQTWNLLRLALSGAGIDGRVPRDDESLWAYFHAADLEFWDANNRIVTPVLVFDQFEEIVQAGEERELAPRLDAFMEELADLVENRIPAEVTRRLEHDPDTVAAFDFNARHFRCVIGFREDFLPDLEQWFVAHSLSTKSRLRVTKMGEAQALAAVEKTGGRLVDGEVAQRIVNFVSAAAGRGAQRFVEIEPALLSVVCFELNSRRLTQGAARISTDLLAGAQEQIIAEFYQRGVSDLDPAVQTFIERELLTESGYRDSCAVDDAVHRHGIPRESLQKLVDRRVLRLEERFGVLRVELTHDVLTPVVRERRDQRQALEARNREQQREAQRQKRTRMLFAIGGSLIGVASLLVIVFFNLFRQAEGEKARVIEAQSTLFLSRANVSLDNNVPAEPIRYLAQAVALNPRNEGAIARMASLATQRSFARKVWEKAFSQAGESAGAAVSMGGDSFAFMSANNKWRFATILAAKPYPTLRESCVVAKPEKGDAGALATFTYDASLFSSPAGAARIAESEIDLARGGKLGDEYNKISSRCIAAPGGKPQPGQESWRLLAVETVSGALWTIVGRDLVRRPAGEAPRELLTGLDDLGEIARVMPSPNGDAVIIAGDKATVLYTRRSGATAAGAYVRRADIARMDAESKQIANVSGAVFNEAGLLALVTVDAGMCQLWETSTAKKRWSRLCGADLHEFVPGKPWAALSGQPPRGGDARAGAISPGGQIEIVDLANGRALGVVKQALAVNHMAFSATGEFAVVASQDRTAKVYQLPALTQVGSTLLHEGAVVEAYFRQPGAGHIVTASFDGSARVWDWRLGTMVVEPMLHPGPVLFARPVLGGAYVLSLGDDGQLRLWRVEVATNVATNEAAAAAPSPDRLIQHPAISRAGDRLAYVQGEAGDKSGGDRRNAVYIARVAGEPVRSTPLFEAKPVYTAPGSVDGLFFSGDSGTLAIAGREPWLAIVPTTNGTGQQLLRFSSPVESAVFVPNQPLIVARLADNSLRVVDLATGRESGLPIKLNQPILDFGISQDGKWLSVATGAQLQVFDVRTGYPVARIAPGGVLAAAVHPVRAEIAYATRAGLSFWRPLLDPRGVKKDDGEKHRFQNKEDKAAREAAKGEGAFVPLKKLLVGLRFTPDGQTLAAYSIDGIATTWDALTLEQGPVLRHSSSVVSMGLSGDGRWLTTTTLDGLARIWDHRTGQLMTDAVNLRDSELEFRVMGAGTWALVETHMNGNAMKADTVQSGYALRMIGLGFKDSPPAWFVPTVAALASGVEDSVVTRPTGEKREAKVSAWWESWLRYVAARNGVNVK